MQTSDTSLFDRIGGVPAITRMVDTFYERVMADPLLAPFFRDVAMDKLQRMQLELFAAALGGPFAYTGRPIAHAHHHLKITLADYQRFVKYLFETLAEFPLSEQDRYEIIGRLNLSTTDIVSAGTGLVG